MSIPRRRFRFGVQAKVQLPALAVIIVLTVITVLLVDRFVQHEMADEAGRTLKLGESVFLKSLDNRAADYLARYRALAEMSVMRTLAELGEPKSLDRFLVDRLADLPEENTALMLFNLKGEAIARRGRGAGFEMTGLIGAAGPVVRRALEGQPSAIRVAVERSAYGLQAVPVATAEGKLVGVLAAALRLDEQEVREMKLPRTEILLVGADRLLVSTLADTVSSDWLRRVTASDGESVEVVVSDVHYLAHASRLKSLGGAVPGTGPDALGIVVLSSYEDRLRELHAARGMLVAIGAAGALLGATIIWLTVRRVTRPLLMLRDNAEAIGRGDFSHRIGRDSDDELGELADAFNRMTANLQASRADLERAMQSLRATQGQLIQSEKLSAVGQFVAGVAHELNNPLTAVVGFAEVLQSTVTDDKIRTNLDRIARSAHRCHKIVHSLLSFARQHPPERKLVQLNTIADGVLELMAYEFRTSNITIVKDYAPELPMTMADPHQLEQVFVNILGNARQSIEPSQREGRITVRTRSADGRVTIEFEDTGPGIRPEHLARIFDPFFTTKPIGKGTGLGLSLVYGIIQEHGGQITARSEFGHGATFAIELPVTHAPPPSVLRGTPTPFPLPAQPTVEANGKTVLVTDDEEWILELATELLRAEGYVVQTAVGGARALELLARLKFDLIISDWKMPGLNGIRLFEHLQATDPGAAKRVLFMTGDVVNDTFQKFLADNGLACLSKPFAIREFRAAVARLMKQPE